MGKKEFLMAVNENPRALTGEEVQLCLEGADAFWLYNGKPDSHVSHALLTSGKHSDGYVNVGGALKEFIGFQRAIAMSLLYLLPGSWDDCFTHIVGADTSSTALAGDIAEIAGASHICMIKMEDRQGKRQAYHPDNGDLKEGDLILHIEELITTSSSALEVRKGIRSRSSVPVRFVPFLPVVVDRSNPDDRVLKVEDSQVISLVQLNIRNFDPGPAACPYCAAGSKAVRPKEGENWRLLTER